MTSPIRLADLVTADRIIPAMYAGNKLEVLEKLSRFAAMKIRVDAELIRRKVLERDDLTTFGIGRGIALPHAAVPDISQPIGIFARLKRPIDFGAADRRRADLVLLLLVPDKDPGMLLRVLSCAARRLRDREVVMRLRAENSAEAAHVILTTDCWRENNPRGTQPDSSHESRI
jgi:PTS system nitrogen regulatory IIA component